jgi:hypothetical protein
MPKPCLRTTAPACTPISIENKIDPGEPLDKDIYGMSPEELADVPSAPGSLEEALAALADDHAFLLKGDVFTQDVIDTWIAIKPKTKSTTSICDPIRTSFSCITTSNRLPAGGFPPPVTFHGGGRIS